MSTPPRDDGREIVEPSDAAEWRAWLAANHEQSESIWLVYFKKGASRTSVSYDEAVEEAICFGWIDSKVQSIDDESYRQLFSPRRPGSIWSKLNKQRIEKVISEGRMTQAGLAKIEAAKADGSWSRYDDVFDLVVPDDLRTALDADPAASEAYEGFAPSAKRAILFWVVSAKRTETRATRIERVVDAARDGKSPLG